jgi:hypothetical protein
MNISSARRSAMNTTLLSTLITLAAALAGCAAPKTAVIDGKTVPRPTLGYTDHDLFAIEHQRAWPQPRGPSSGLHAYGGSLWGRVCGSDVNFEAEYRGRYLDISGFITPAIAKNNAVGMGSGRPVHIEVRDHGGVREVIGFMFDGNIASKFGPPVIDFRYNRDMLEGQIGWRHYRLHREDNQLVGTYTEVGEVRPYVLDGVDELWLMPAPDQVALVPFMMTCGYNHAFERGAAPPDPELPVSFRQLTVR